MVREGSGWLYYEGGGVRRRRVRGQFEVLDQGGRLGDSGDEEWSRLWTTIFIVNRRNLPSSSRRWCRWPVVAGCCCWCFMHVGQWAARTGTMPMPWTKLLSNKKQFRFSPANFCVHPFIGVNSYEDKIWNCKKWNSKSKVTYIQFNCLSARFNANRAQNVQLFGMWWCTIENF